MKTLHHRSGNHLDSDGARIYYEVAGNPQGSPLLVLHGGFGSMEDFNRFLPDLHREFQLIGIDSRGQGKSTLGPGPLTYEQIQKDVQRVLAHLNIQSLSIIGFSDGGITAYRLACLTSLKLEKLVTIGARWHLKNTVPVRDILSKVTADSWRNKFSSTVDSYQKLNPEPDFDRLAPAIVRMWLDPDASGYPNEAVKNISCPLLMVRGDEDHLLRIEAVAELSNLVKNSKLLNIPFAGHAAFEDQKEIFMLGLNHFLDLA